MECVVNLADHGRIWCFGIGFVLGLVCHVVILVAVNKDSDY